MLENHTVELGHMAITLFCRFLEEEKEEFSF
jgi:hypothetical protein